MESKIPESFEDTPWVVKREEGDTKDLEPGEVPDNKTYQSPPFEQDQDQVHTYYGSIHTPTQPQPPAIQSQGLEHVCNPLLSQQQHQHQTKTLIHDPVNHQPQALSNQEQQRNARNHARLQEMVTRLQNIQGSVDDLLEIAAIQQQIDRAWNDMTRAQGQLKAILRQFERDGCITNRQSRRIHAATEELTTKSQQISNHVNELSRWRGRQMQSNAPKQTKKGSA
ncbi:hypothetical protein F4810DRAFT_74413 [Camillea tinctor]|nr:hypothetical protein F4810DRAFT_74413 [Camillea tinctor]